MHEQAAGVANALAGDLADDAVLLDALLGAGRVGLGVPGAAVEDAMGAPGGAASEAAPLDEGDVDAAQRQVPGDAGSRRPPPTTSTVGSLDTRRPPPVAPGPPCSSVLPGS